MVCYIENTGLTPKEKDNLQAQHEYYYNDLIGRDGFKVTKTIDDKEVIVPNQQGIQYLLDTNKEVGKVYGLGSALTVNNEQVVTVNVLNLLKDNTPSAIKDYLLDISLEGNSQFKDLAIILQDYNYTHDIREVTSIDKIGEPDYFGKITPTEILIDKEAIQRWAEEKGLNPKDELHRVIIHEILHSVSIESIKTNSKLQKELTELMDLVEEKSWNLGYTKANAFRDIYEFVAEVYTDVDLQKVMKQIPYKEENKSIWNKFLESIMLAMKKLGFVEYSTLDKVLSLSNELFKPIINKVDVQDTTTFPNC